MSSQYVEALRKRWLIVISLLVLGGLAGFVSAASQPVLYRATSSVYVGANTGGSQSELLQGSNFTQNIVESYVELATLPVVLDPVIAQLHLRGSSESLARRVTATLQVNTVIIQVSATDPSPSRAAAIANAVTASLARAAEKLSSNGKAPAITMRPVAHALAPTSAYSPNVTAFVAGGTVLGLVLGLLVAVVWQFLDTRIGSEAQVRGTPGLKDAPFLGALPHQRAGSRPANVFQDDPGSVLAEGFRRLVTNLEFAGIDSRVGSVTVTSPMPGDGKTTTSVNLARAAAERSQQVLLVDGDLRRPKVADYVGIDGGLGLTDVLRGASTLEEAVQHVGAVDVLPAGTLPPNVTQLVTSEAMARLFDALKRRYDLVIVDAPPLLPVADSLTFSRLTDGAIVLARQRATRRKQFAQAVEALGLVDARILGVVLNDVPRSDSAGYGYAPHGGARREPSGSPQQPAPFFAVDEGRVDAPAGATLRG